MASGILQIVKDETIRFFRNVTQMGGYTEVVGHGLGGRGRKGEDDHHILFRIFFFFGVNLRIFVNVIIISRGK